MTPFLYIDGPLAGYTLLSDFRSQRYLKHIYTKHTYAALVTEEETGIEWRMYRDIATVNNPPSSFVGVPKVESIMGDEKQAPILSCSILLPLYSTAARLQKFNLKDLQAKPHRVNRGQCRFCKRSIDQCLMQPICIKKDYL